MSGYDPRQDVRMDGVLVKGSWYGKYYPQTWENPAEYPDWEYDAKDCVVENAKEFADALRELGIADVSDQAPNLTEYLDDWLDAVSSDLDDEIWSRHPYGPADDDRDEPTSMEDKYYF